MCFHSTTDCYLAHPCDCIVSDSLAQPQQVEALVNYIVAEPDTDATDKLKFIYPYKVLFSPVPDFPTAGSLACVLLDVCARSTRLSHMQSRA